MNNKGGGRTTISYQINQSNVNITINIAWDNKWGSGGTIGK